MVVMTRLVLLALALACSPAGRREPVEVEPAIDPVAIQRPSVQVPSLDSAPPQVPPPEPVDRIAPPEVAYAHGWMSLASTGADRFIEAHPAFDGRGIVIGVLDTGIDPSIAGLVTTSTGDPKLLDVRDFSGEGAVPLARVMPVGDTVAVGRQRLRGFGRVVALNAEGPWYAGTIAEIPLGEPPASDLNGNGVVADTLALVVTRATDGWVVFADTDGDGSLAGERPVRDYLVGREWFGWAARGRTPPIAVAANFADDSGEPTLTLAFDLSGHGSHVAGIAAAHDLYGVEGFNGVAPGAQLLGLKISNSAQGSVSTTGAMIRAVEYAVRFAESRRLGLVLNLSFGVGNEIEGEARIDRMLDSVLARHPSVVLTVSAGNDGPGLSTIGFPGSTDRAITAGATLPPSFLPPAAGGAAPPERIAYFSSRGGELAKPDVVAPGVAYSSVPRWNAGDEVKQGTSMAAPHAAGLAALLLSGLRQERRPAAAARIRRALMVTARAAPELPLIEEGRGLPDVEAAYRWLAGDHRVTSVQVRVPGTPRTAAWIVRRPGARDSVARFELLPADSGSAGSYTLRSNVPWLVPARQIVVSTSPTVVDVRLRTADLVKPGAYAGTVSGWGPDTLAGPAFRLVVTVVVPVAAAGDSLVLQSATVVPAGSVLRSFFLADTARPFQVRVAAGSATGKGIAFLHEPDGVPYREGNAAPVSGEPAVFQVDGRDVRGGAYEVDFTSSPNRAANATVVLHHAPFTLRAARTASAVTAAVTGIGTRTTVELEAGLIGVERTETVVAQGSAERRVPFVLPSWATAVVVDVAMDRSQWGRFTDFGVTLFDSTGRQLGKDPMEYASGRLSVDVAEGKPDRQVALALFPGFADPADSAGWSVKLSIRLYADSMTALAPAAQDSTTVTIARGATVTRRFELPQSPWPLHDGFFPLGVLIARSGGRSWTREVGLPAPPGSAAR